jgi:dihydrofolate synthase/folylpolyglutamate synthase
VIEAGIGGRYDTTRVLPGNLVALTSVDLEHTELLGQTKELIAYDKLDLCPDNGTVVIHCQEPELRRRISAYSKVRRLREVDATDTCKTELLRAKLESVEPGMSVRIRTDSIDCEAFVPLVGTHQLENISVAVSLVESWVKSHRPSVSRAELEAAVIAGLSRAHWPGRFQCISDSPLAFIDVGHSPDACLRLAETVKQFLPDKRILLVTGVSSNKSVEKILELLVPLGDQILCTRAYHHGERVERIADLVRQLDSRKEVKEAATIEEASRLARDMAGSENFVILVAGGLFLAIEFHVAWNGGDPKSLLFL